MQFEGTGSLEARAPHWKDWSRAWSTSRRTGLPAPGQRVGRRFVEGRTVSCGKLPQMVKALGARACGDVGAPAFEKARPRRPQFFQANVLMQAHATHLADGAAERPDRDAELAGEIGGIDRSSWMCCDVIVDPLHELDRPLALDGGTPVRERIDAKQIVEREQQAFLEMGGDLGRFEQGRLHRRGSQNVEQELPYVEQSGAVRDIGPQIVRLIEPAPVAHAG